MSEGKRFLSAFATLGRKGMKGGSFVSADSNAPTTVERTTLPTIDPSNRDGIASPIIKVGLIQLSKLGSGSWKSYKLVLRSSRLCFHRKNDHPDSTEPVIVFELLKLMVKTTADDELRMFYGGEWFECRSSEGKPDLIAWTNAITTQRADLYERSSASSALSPRPFAKRGDESGPLPVGSSGDSRRDQRSVDFGNVDGPKAKVDAALKRMELMFLEYHRCELECEVLSNNLKDHAANATALIEKYDMLVVERERSTQALLQSWARQQAQQLEQQRGAAALAATLAGTSQQILEVHKNGLKRCIKDLQVEKERLHARSSDEKIERLDAAVSRCRSILTAVSPSFHPELLLQRRVFELQFMIDELENSNAALAKLVDSQIDSELQVFGFDLNKPIDAVEKTLTAWKNLASMKSEDMSVWLHAKSASSPAVVQSTVTVKEDATNSPKVDYGKPPTSEPIKSPRKGAVKLKPALSGGSSGSISSSPPSSSSGSGKFAETQAESLVLIQTVESKVAELAKAVAVLNDLKNEEKVEMSASSNSSLALSSLAASGSLSVRMVRSATVGELHSTSAGSSVLKSSNTNTRDIEYEPLASFAGKPEVKSATTERLISLVVTQGADHDLRRNLLLTYRMYITPADLLGRLMLFYTSTPEMDDVADRTLMKMMQMLETIRSGVVETMVLWAKLCPHDFALESVRTLLQRFIALLNDTYADESATQLFRDLMTATNVLRPVAVDTSMELQQGSLMSLTNLPIDHVAIQLFLLEHDIYSRMQAVELHKISKGFAFAPTIKAMTEFFNRVCKLLVTQILREKTYDPTAVSAAIAAVISLGHASKSINNWDAVMMCVAVLSTTAVTRLTDAWSLLSRDDQKRAEELSLVTRKNFKVLRESMTNSSSPAIPHVALFVRDLTALDESPTYIVANGHVNFFKIKTAGQIIWQVLRHRDVPLQTNLGPVKKLQSWILHSEVMSDQEAYERSKAYKPHGAAQPQQSVIASGLQALRKNKQVNRRSIILG